MLLCDDDNDVFLCVNEQKQMQEVIDAMFERKVSCSSISVVVIVVVVVVVVSALVMRINTIFAVANRLCKQIQSNCNFNTKCRMVSRQISVQPILVLVLLCLHG